MTKEMINAVLFASLGRLVVIIHSCAVPLIGTETLINFCTKKMKIVNNKLVTSNYIILLLLFLCRFYL